MTNLFGEQLQKHMEAHLPVRLEVQPIVSIQNIKFGGKYIKKVTPKENQIKNPFSHLDLNSLHKKRRLLVEANRGIQSNRIILLIKMVNELIKIKEAK